MKVALFELQVFKISSCLNECTRKTCCPTATINQGSKVSSENIAVLLCSAWDLALYCKILNENIQRCIGVTIS